MRIRSQLSSRGGMKSMSVAAPSAVSKSVSRTSEPSVYRRLRFVTSPTGAIRQRPFSGPPRSAAKHAAESKRGTQSHSIEPVAVDQRRGFQVADQCEVVDAFGQMSVLGFGRFHVRLSGGLLRGVPR